MLLFGYFLSCFEPTAVSFVFASSISGITPLPFAHIVFIIACYFDTENL